MKVCLYTSSTRLSPIPRNQPQRASCISTPRTHHCSSKTKQAHKFSMAPEPDTEQTPLLTQSNSDYRAVKRPNLLRAATTKSITTSADQDNHATPLLSKPILNRTNSAATVLQEQGTDRRTHSTKPPGQPRTSLLRRTTEVLTSALDFPTTITNHLGAPPTPSHWTDHTHRKALLTTWDTVNSSTSPTSASKYSKSILAQLVTTEKRMLERYPELGEGEVFLGREWIEFVLGVCMRHPFCTEERLPGVGRWQVLSAGGGGRGMWGPF